MSSCQKTKNAAQGTALGTHATIVLESRILTKRTQMATILVMPAGVVDDKSGKHRERQNHLLTSSKDSDGDSVFDQNDNCPQVKNPLQVLNNSKPFGGGWVLNTL